MKSPMTDFSILGMLELPYGSLFPRAGSELISNQMMCGSEFPHLVAPLVREAIFEKVYLPRKWTDLLKRQGSGNSICFDCPQS